MQKSLASVLRLIIIAYFATLTYTVSAQDNTLTVTSYRVEKGDDSHVTFSPGRSQTNCSSNDVYTTCDTQHKAATGFTVPHINIYNVVETATTRYTLVCQSVNRPSRSCYPLTTGQKYTYTLKKGKIEITGEKLRANVVSAEVK